MRQFFTWRMWATVAALIGLVVLLKGVLPTQAEESGGASVAREHTVDFISLVYEVQPGNGFSINNGIVSGSAELIIDGQRTMHVVSGTSGDITCKGYTKLAKCVVVADLLGDAVIWFALVDAAPGPRINASPIVAVLDDGVMRLADGWLVHSAATIDRPCAQETGSLSEFLRRFGPASTTVIDVAKQQIIAVRCDDSVTDSG